MILLARNRSINFKRKIHFIILKHLLNARENRIILHLCRYYCFHSVAFFGWKLIQSIRNGIISIKFEINLHNNLLWSALPRILLNHLNYISKYHALAACNCVQCTHKYAINVDWISLLLFGFYYGSRLRCAKYIV